MRRRDFLQFVLATPIARVIPAMPIAAAPVLLSERALEDALIEIAKIRDERGLRLNIMPTKMYVPAENYLEMLRIAREGADY